MLGMSFEVQKRDCCSSCHGHIRACALPPLSAVPVMFKTHGLPASHAHLLFSEHLW